MSRAKRILLIGGVLIMSVSTADARIWGSRKAQQPAAPASLPGAVVLNAVEVNGAEVILRTSSAPAYTSYSPSPGVFVIDLTGTTRDAAAVIPTELPSALRSLTADEVVEMGTKLTRITLRLAGSGAPEISAADHAVVVTVPAPPAESSLAEIDVLPAVIPAAAQASDVSVPEPVEEATPEPLEEQFEEPMEAPRVAEGVPPARVDVPLPRARNVRSIGAITDQGQMAVRIAGDGELHYKAFRLEGPPRLVIDLDGVRNSAPRSTVAVGNDLVRQIRVAQFQPAVARVVVDLASKTEWTIRKEAESLIVSFPQTAAMASVPADVPAAVVAPPPAPVQVAETRPAPAPQWTPEPVPAAVAVADDLSASVPTIAENAPAWKMPEPAPAPRTARVEPARPPATQGARKIINSAVDQEPPIRSEDVFGTAPAVQPTAVQTLSGPRTLSGGPRVFNGEPLDLSLTAADLRDVLLTFADLTGLNIAVDPGVSGSVTVNFVDVPWDQALDLILRQNGLTYILEGNVMRVGTIDRLAAETAAQRRLAEEERLNVPLTTLSFKLSYARATDVAALLRDIASPRARIITDTRTNQLMISEVPIYLETMQNLIATVDIPNRQVMIEARIVESSRTFTQSWGVDFDFGGILDPAVGTGTGLVFPNRVGFRGGPFNFGGSAAPVLTLNFLDVLGVFDLDVTLRAAESAGYIKVISAPRVTTQDNTAAEIQSGFQIPYQTRVNFTTTITYLDATLRLSVTPQITEAGTVIMDIQVQKNEPAEGLAIEGGAGTPLTTRQARTRLMVRDGGTAVIAGIFQTRDNRSQSRVPILHNIPVIGNLFKTHNTSTAHDELLIFITPRIVRG